MDLARLTKLEELHQPVEACFFTPDGLGEEWVDVCQHCNPLDDNYGALYPCETLQDAYYEYENNN